MLDLFSLVLTIDIFVCLFFRKIKGRNIFPWNGRCWKKNRQYKDYMKKLLEYLKHFFGRIEPLQDLHRIISEVVAHVEEQWAKGTLDGWEDEVKQNTFILDQNPLPTVPSEEELKIKSRETLLLLSSAYKLKIGGTPEQFIERLLSITDSTLPETNTEKHKGGSNDEKLKEIALLEAKMKKLCDLLDETIDRTKQSAKKKQAKQKQVMTYEEIEAESEQIEAKADLDFVTHLRVLDTHLANHQITSLLTILRTKPAKKKQESEAERLYICGYCHWNRNAFEEHSMSRSHVEGLGDREDKELFKGITKLEEANGMYIAQIKRRVDFLWNPEFEEFEDEDGNLFTKKFTHRADISVEVDTFRLENRTI
ncbi:hypothetical protein EZV62_006154 [Acer yangbiense]|uniref:Uncharacterized protein n=1 Tax=Acer yangbiense TaxID=1000413 RepID=A0A5C7IQ45_9ROSI|nr:hypothetical protein EZV62_006154 [Acer yangbiense]